MTTTGYPGHFVPLVPFAQACARAGHEVRVAAPRSQGGIVERMGLDLQPCADPPPEELARLVAAVAELPQRDGHAHMMSEGFARVAVRAVLADLVEIVDSWRPDVVVRESQEYAGALAAERAGIPHVRVALGLAAQEARTLGAVAATVDELRGEAGLPSDPDATALRDSPYLTLVPSALEQRGDDGAGSAYRFRAPLVGGRSRADLPDRWTRGDAPRVYMSFGSVAGMLGLFPRVYRAAIESLAGVAASVLVTIGEHADPAALDPLPPNVHVERWIAQEAIVGDAAAVVCHGGYGSVLGALAAGVPVVALPLFGDDQWLNAGRVAEVGAGIAVDGDRGAGRRMLDGPGDESFAALAGAVEAVIGDSRYRAGARGIADAIAALPPVDSAVAVLSAVARGTD